MKVSANSFPQDIQLLGILESVIDGTRAELYATQEALTDGCESLACATSIHREFVTEQPITFAGTK